MAKPLNPPRGPGPGPESTEKRAGVISVISYDADQIHEQPVQDLTELRALLDQGGVLWVSLEGLPDEHQLAQLEAILELHPGLVHQLSKSFVATRIEDFGGQRFIATHMFRLLNHRLVDESMAIAFGPRFVLSVQEGMEGDCFEPVRNRLRHKAGNLRPEKAQHLAIALLDAVIDNYFQVISEKGELLDALQDDILQRHDRSAPARIHSIKRDISKLRRAIWPLRDSLNTYYRDSGDDISRSTRLFLRDCIESAVRVMEMLEVNRELCSDLMDLHLSTASARMNEVMKVLTIITTLFIPPTFIAGIYGMNFNPDKSPWNMPELNWFWGYPFAMGLMAVVVALLVYFLYARGCFQREITARKRRRNEEQE
jgi:magnesium transporter